MQKILTLFLLILFTGLSYTQTEKKDTTLAVQDSIQALKKKFENFEYGDVINRTNKLLTERNILNNNDLIELYRIKGISHFSLAEDQAAENSLVEILKIDSSFSFDSTKTSPKILTFYNQVKSRYLNKLLQTAQQTIVRIDTVYIPANDSTKITGAEFHQTMLYSLFVPGLGHLYKGDNIKGWLLTTLSSASLGAMVYFILDANKKENDYLNAIDPIIIQNEYKQFNQSYRFRNLAIISYTAIWLYSQLDLILFSSENEDYLESSNFLQLKTHPTFGTMLELKYAF